MKTLLFGDPKSGNILVQKDPDGPTEAEFEWHVARVLSWLYQDYQCIVFTGTFKYDDRGYRPDLALVAKDFSHWFVLEVELLSHSLERHVLPQVRAFRYGDPQKDCITPLSRELGVSRSRAETLLNYVPRSVAVIANKPDMTWALKLSALEIQMVTVLVYGGDGGDGGETAYEADGVLEAVEESLGFAVYSATDRSLRLPAACRLPRGRIQIADQTGGVGWWTAVEERGDLWVTKESGTPDIPNGIHVQILRFYTGRLMLRRPPPR